MSRIIERPSLISVAAFAAALSLSIGACQPSPGDPVESGVGDMVRVTFMIGASQNQYAGFGTASMTISPDDLQRIGTASAADAALFPDRSVYALAGRRSCRRNSHARPIGRSQR